MHDRLYPRFTDGEFQRRHERVRNLMRQNEVEALLVAGGPGSADVYHLTSYLPFAPAWVLFPLMGEATIFHHFFNHGPCVREMAVVSDIRWYGAYAPTTLAQNLKERDLGRATIGVVGLAGAIPYAQFVALQQALPEATFKDVGRAFQLMRWVRGEEELAWFRRSAHLSDLACEALENGIRPGLRELDLSRLMHDAFLPAGGQLALQFMASTSMHQPQRCAPFQYPSNRTLEKGDVVITEISINYWTYWSQIHRPFAVGEPPTALYQQLYDVGYECFERIVRVLRPGVTSEAIVEASSVIEERGFTTFDSVFHGEMGKGPELGTPSAVHPMEPFTLQENMVMVVQPNPATRDLRAGLQLGAAVLITADGAENLHRYPFKFPVCGM